MPERAAVLAADARALTAAIAAVRALFPPGVALGGCTIGAAPQPMPAEMAALANAVPARRAEFAAGRAAAREAMTHLGHPPAAIPAGADRAPVWPAGLAGSITHSMGLALAVLAPQSLAASLGIDAEPDAPLPAEIVDLVTRPEERDWIAAQPEPLRAARMVFAAKEAAYKCQFPISHSIIGFEALFVNFIPDGRVDAIFAVSVPPFAIGERLLGRVGSAAGLVIAGFVVPHGRVGTADGLPQ